MRTILGRVGTVYAFGRPAIEERASGLPFCEYSQHTIGGMSDIINPFTRTKKNTRQQEDPDTGRYYIRGRENLESNEGRTVRKFDQVETYQSKSNISAQIY